MQKRRTRACTRHSVERIRRPRVKSGCLRSLCLFYSRRDTVDCQLGSHGAGARALGPAATLRRTRWCTWFRSAANLLHRGMDRARECLPAQRHPRNHAVGMPIIEVSKTELDFAVAVIRACHGSCPRPTGSHHSLADPRMVMAKIQCGIEPGGRAHSAMDVGLAVLRSDVAYSVASLTEA